MSACSGCEQRGFETTHSFGGEDVAGDFVVDAVAEHEEADDGHEEVEGEGEGVGYVDAFAVFVCEACLLGRGT